MGGIWKGAWRALYAQMIAVVNFFDFSLNYRSLGLFSGFQGPGRFKKLRQAYRRLQENICFIFVENGLPGAELSPKNKKVHD